MNYRMIFNMIGKVLIILAVLLVLPLAFAIAYGETSTVAFFATSLLSLGLGGIITFATKPKTQIIYAKEGLLMVALCWIVVSVIGALPFVISGEIPNYIDALFETVSGFSTTGASILDDVTVLSHGIALWRSFTHFIGGMGVLVFVMAITLKTPDRSMHILRAEMPGPIIGKIVPKAKNTAIILYAIYIAMTLILTILLVFGDMSFYEALVHAFGTAGTGGFGIKPDSIASYSSYSQWVIAIFMLLFGINFNLYFFIIVGKVSAFFKSRELWVYLSIVAFSVIVICTNNYKSYQNFSELIKMSTFQVSSIITTTGYATTDINSMPNLSKALIIILMFMGSCAGSTAGGFKISRVIILVKKVFNDLKKVLHPSTATVVKFEGKRVDDDTLSGVTSYLTVYVLVFFVLFFLLSMDTNPLLDFEANFSACVSCYNNIGPAYSVASQSYSVYSYFSKIVLTLSMLLGRLELYPILLAIMPTTWIKK